MGVTIHYCGTMDDMTLVEEMEDRVIDVAVALGGRATIWRSFADDDPSRAIRGLMLELAPGQDAMSLLVSPEGQLINFFEIERAEKQPLDEPPTCCVKTQFGSVQGHIAIVYLLDTLKSQYISDLYVNDESGFYEHRDPQLLSQKIKQLNDAIRSLGKGLQEYGLSDEAAEDPAILATRVARVARLVAERLQTGPAEEVDAPADADDTYFENEPTLEEQVEKMHRRHRRNQLRSERMTRRIAEATAAGMSTEEALDLALREAGIEPPQRNDPFDGYDENEKEDDRWADSNWEVDSQSEPWIESLESTPFDEPLEFEGRPQHPTFERAEKLLLEIMILGNRDSAKDSFANVAARGLLDLVGGLMHATSGGHVDRFGRALAIVQLKQALKGHAFCRGAIFGLRDSGQIDKATSDRYHEELAAILKSIHDLMAAAWDEGGIS